MQNTFTTLNQHFVQAPVLRHPDPTKLFIVETNALDIPLGVGLSQSLGPGVQLHPCAFLFGKVTEAEENYKIAE